MDQKDVVKIGKKFAQMLLRKDSKQNKRHKGGESPRLSRNISEQSANNAPNRERTSVDLYPVTPTTPTTTGNTHLPDENNIILRDNSQNPKYTLSRQYSQAEEEKRRLPRLHSQPGEEKSRLVCFEDDAFSKPFPDRRRNSIRNRRKSMEGGDSGITQGSGSDAELPSNLEDISRQSSTGSIIFKPFHPSSTSYTSDADDTLSNTSSQYFKPYTKPMPLVSSDLAESCLFDSDSE